MLVLSRKRGESLVIDDRIRVIVHRIVGNRVTLGIEAPNDVHILRAELELAPEHVRTLTTVETVGVGKCAGHP
jgi:carbon storage regulator